MSVFSSLRRYRQYLLILTLSVIAVILLSEQPAISQFFAASFTSKNQQTVTLKEKMPLSVTGNVRKTLLENGLTVLTKEVQTAPVVTVQAWYKVGSRNEEEGVNGIAHQLEHMMFKGTKNRPIQFGRLFSALGSDSNAFTSYDQTAYYGTVERDKLKALLVLEADRMQNALINLEQLNNEKRVVISELQGYENSPDYRLTRSVMEAAFPNHPYGLPVGGTKADVEKFTVEAVRKYYSEFYSPNNAVLVIVGDFETKSTLALVEEIFGKLNPSLSRVSANPVARDIKEIKSKNEKPIILKEPGAAALLEAIYPIPDVNHPDVPALEVMDYILTQGRNSRLYQALVESGKVSDLTAYVANLIEFGWYDIQITADPEENLQEIDALLQDSLAKLISHGVTEEEVNRAKAQLEASAILTNRDIINQATQLGTDETTSGDYHYTDRYLAGVRQVTAGDIQRVAGQYLTQESRTVGFFQPTEVETQGKATINSSGKAHSAQTAEDFGAVSPLNSSEVAKYLPSLEHGNTSVNQALPETFNLNNGLKVLLLADKSTPTITMSGFIKAGSEFDPLSKGGLASLTAESLMSGTTSKDALAIAKALDEKGASLDFETYREGVRLQGNSLAADLPVLIQTLADTLINSNFPQKELELSRQQSLTGLHLDLDDPEEVAKRTFVQEIYPLPHPLHVFPTQKTLRQIVREDLIQFKNNHYRPDTTTLVLVGDFSHSQVKQLIEKEFGIWKSQGEPPALVYPSVRSLDKVINLNPVLPGKSQSVTYMGYTAINRQDPRYYAALVLNQIVGGDTLSSRLGAEVRDRQGLTYGIYSNFLAGKKSGTFLIEMQTNPEDANRAISSTRELLKEVNRKGVNKDEVDSAKRSLISSYIVSLANPEEVANRILMNEVYGLDREELRSFYKKIKNVTLAQVNKTASELLHPDKIVVVTAGPSVLANQGIR
jgi:zinc protease